MSRDSFAFGARENTKMRKFGDSRPIFISLSQSFARYQKLKNNYLYLAGSFAVTELNSLYPIIDKTQPNRCLRDDAIKKYCTESTGPRPNGFKRSNEVSHGITEGTLPLICISKEHFVKQLKLYISRTDELRFE